MIPSQFLGLVPRTPGRHMGRWVGILPLVVLPLIRHRWQPTMAAVAVGVCHPTAACMAPREIKAHHLRWDLWESGTVVLPIQGAVGVPLLLRRPFHLMGIRTAVVRRRRTVRTWVPVGAEVDLPIMDHRRRRRPTGRRPRQGVHPPRRRSMVKVATDTMATTRLPAVLTVVLCMGIQRSMAVGGTAE